MLENLTQKQKIIFGIIIIFMLLIIVYYIYLSLTDIQYNSDNLLDSQFLDTNNLETENIAIDENVTEAEEIQVHISGCVKENKVVSLPEGSRVNDAIEAVGRTYKRSRFN